MASNIPRMLSFPSCEMFAASQKTANGTCMSMKKCVAQYSVRRLILSHGSPRAPYQSTTIRLDRCQSPHGRHHLGHQLLGREIFGTAHRAGGLHWRSHLLGGAFAR